MLPVMLHFSGVKIECNCENSHQNQPVFCKFWKGQQLPYSTHILTCLTIGESQTTAWYYFHMGLCKSLESCYNIPQFTSISQVFLDRAKGDSLMRRRVVISRRRMSSSYADQIRGSRSQWQLILYGIVVAIIGLFLLVYNLNDTAPYLKISGHVTNEYEHLLNDGLGNMQYDANWLQIDSSKDLFVFDKNDFTPVVADKSFFKGQKIDIYATNDTPKQIAAIQLYDQFGIASTRYVTAEYEQNPNTYSTGSLSPIVGLVIMLIGLFVMIYGAWKFLQARNRLRAEEAAASASSYASRTWGNTSSSLGSSLSTPYKSPKKSLPPQD